MDPQNFVKEYIQHVTQMLELIRTVTPFKCAITISIKPIGDAEQQMRSPIVLTDAPIPKVIEWLKMAETDPNVTRHEGDPSKLDFTKIDVKVTDRFKKEAEESANKIPDNYKRK